MRFRTRTARTVLAGLVLVGVTATAPAALAEMPRLSIEPGPNGELPEGPYPQPLDPSQIQAVPVPNDGPFAPGGNGGRPQIEAVPVPGDSPFGPGDFLPPGPGDDPEPPGPGDGPGDLTTPGPGDDEPGPETPGPETPGPSSGVDPAVPATPTFTG